MLLISEVMRVLWNALTLAFRTKKVGLLLIVVVAGLFAVLAASVTVVAPVAIYPFL